MDVIFCCFHKRLLFGLVVMELQRDFPASDIYKHTCKVGRVFYLVTGCVPDGEIFAVGRYEKLRQTVMCIP